jgi:glycosyltransferase involved in cell wall biosynthesis
VSFLENALSIVVPAFNEGDEFEHSLKTIAGELDMLGLPYELVVVDDGSRDGTSAGIERAAAVLGERVVVVTHSENQGLAAALRTGFRHARHPNVAVLDADLSYAPSIVGDMLKQMRRTEALIVAASPYMKGGRVSNVPPVRLMASRCANLLLSHLTGRKVSTLTGMVRLYNRSFLQRALTSEPIGEFNSWILVHALKDGVPVAEVPAHLAWPMSRRQGTSRVPLGKLFRGTQAVIKTIRSMSKVEMRRTGRDSASPSVPSELPTA